MTDKDTTEEKTVKKSFTFTQFTEEEINLLEEQAKKEYRSLSSLITIQVKKLAHKLKEQKQQSI